MTISYNVIYPRPDSKSFFMSPCIFKKQANLKKKFFFFKQFMALYKMLQKMGDLKICFKNNMLVVLAVVEVSSSVGAAISSAQFCTLCSYCICY